MGSPLIFGGVIIFVRAAPWRAGPLTYRERYNTRGLQIKMAENAGCQIDVRNGVSRLQDELGGARRCFHAQNLN